MDFGAIMLSVGAFTGVVVGLVVVILVAKQLLIPEGNVTIMVNEQKEISVPQGGKLMGALYDAGIMVSSACGGGGTCAQCLVKVHEGGGEILEMEKGHISPQRGSRRLPLVMSGRC